MNYLCFAIGTFFGVMLTLLWLALAYIAGEGERE